MPRTFIDVCRSHGGLEDPSGPCQFEPFSDAIPALKEFGATIPALSESQFARIGRLYFTRACYLIVEIARPENDASIRGYLASGKWHRCVCATQVSVDPVDISEFARYAITRGIDNMTVSVGFYLQDKFDARWRPIDKHLLSCVLAARGIPSAQRDPACGSLIADPITLVNLPFQPEYPGKPEDRLWNLGSAQYTYSPSEGGPHPHWDMVLAHCGQDLDSALSVFDWASLAAKPNERLKLSEADEAWLEKPTIKTGADYLLHWAACMLREPACKLPYLFFWGPENSGKSTYHEALSLLMTKGVVSADRALTNSSDFNGELANGILAFIEEKDISQSPGARNKLKDWVTSPTISIRRMRTDAYRVENMLHFVQCSNSRSACVVTSGDTRITMAHVPKPAAEIPRDRLFARLAGEAPHFMRTLIDLQLSPTLGRLRLPVVETSSKQSAAEEHVSDYAMAIAEYMEGQSKFEGTVAALADELGPGAWTRNLRRARPLLDVAMPFFHSRKITLEYLPRSMNGKPIKIVKS